MNLRAMHRGADTAAVDAVVLRACREEIRKLRADLRALLEVAEGLAQSHAAKAVCQRARKALSRRSP